MTTVRFGRIVELVRENAPRSQDFKIGLEAIEPGTGRMVSAPVTEYDGVGTGFRKGDVLFGKLRPYLAKAWLADRPGSAVGEFHVYRPGNRVVPSYLKWMLLARNFLDPVASSVFGAKMPRADWAFIRDVEVHVPDPSEQRSIAYYLDRETARIDILIEEQQRLIEMLRERRTAIRVRLALHGTTSRDEIDSPLPWARRLPSNWRVVPLTSVAELGSGHTPSRTRDDWWQGTYIPWVSLHDVGSMRSGGKYIHDTAQHISDEGLANSSARLLPAGTVVLSRDATVGRTAIMAVPMATSQHFAAWTCGNLLDPEYLWVLFSGAMQPFFDSFQNGSTIRTIGMGDLKAFRIPLPPITEQRRIVACLDEQTAKIDALIAETARFIELSKERRAALITAAVTGQIDLRDEVV